MHVKTPDFRVLHAKALNQPLVICRSLVGVGQRKR
jgi:hypothetical protein